MDKVLGIIPLLFHVKSLSWTWRSNGGFNLMKHSTRPVALGDGQEDNHGLAHCFCNRFDVQRILLPRGLLPHRVFSANKPLDSPQRANTRKLTGLPAQSEH